MKGQDEGKRIQFFVNNWIFGAVSLREVMRRAARIGFDGIELVGEPDQYTVPEVKALMNETGLKIQSICGMFPGPGRDDLRALCHPEARERAKAVAYVRACVDLATGLGARSVLVAPGLVGRPEYFTTKADDRKRAVEAIDQAAELIAATGILLTLEPINRYEVGVVHSIADAIAMAEEIGRDNVRAMGDTFHMQIEEGDGIPNALRRGGGYWIQHLHAADNTREAPGLGTMNWREILRALLDIGYEGGVSLEPLPKGAQPYDARAGLIPAEVLDHSLAFGLKHLQWSCQVNTHHLPATA